MRAVRFTGPIEPGDARVSEAAEPVAGPGQALVRLRAAALNHRDLYVLRGQRTPPGHEFTVGSDGAGVVAALGPGARGPAVGDEVVIYPGLAWGDGEETPGPDHRLVGGPADGAFADYVALPVECLLPRPAHLTWEESAALTLAGVTAYRAAVTKGRVGRGTTVLIHGVGGGVMAMALQICVALGARALVTSGDAGKRDRARAMGAAVAIDYTAPDWPEAVRMATDGYGPEVILDGVGAATMPIDVGLIRRGGRIVSFGLATGSVAEIDLALLYGRHASLLGTSLGSPRGAAALLRLCDAHQIRPVVDSVFPLENVGAAFDRLQGRERFGKVVLRIGE
jgi:NADPH:quinone reductase-like Zn-dependent oxidoreductase